MAAAKDANIYHGQVVGHGTGSTITLGPEPTKPAKPAEPPMVTQHAEQYTSSYTAYPAHNRRPPPPHMRPQKPYYGGAGGDGYYNCWGEAPGAYGYRPPPPPPAYGRGGGSGGYGYCPPSEFGWGAAGDYDSYYGGGRHGGGGYGFSDGGYGGGGFYGGGGYGAGGGGGGGSGYGGGHGYGRPPHMSTGWIAAAGAAAYGAYQHHMRKHHQEEHGHGHGGGGDGGGCSCGRGCSGGCAAAMHGEFEHEHHTKFKHSTAHHDVKYGEHDVQTPHVTVLEKRTTELVQA